MASISTAGKSRSAKRHVLLKFYFALLRQHHRQDSSWFDIADTLSIALLQTHPYYKCSHDSLGMASALFGHVYPHEEARRHTNLYLLYFLACEYYTACVSSPTSSRRLSRSRPYFDGLPPPPSPAQHAVCMPLSVAQLGTSLCCCRPYDGTCIGAISTDRDFLVPVT